MGKSDGGRRMKPYWVDRTWCETCKTFVKQGRIFEFCECEEE